MCAQTSRQPEIVFGLAGEGRGHATRALTLVKAIGDSHRFRLLTSHDAFRFLEPLVSELPHVTLERLPGLKFYYRDGKLDLARSIKKGLGYLTHLRGRAKKLAVRFQAEPPALVISDFESTVSWAAYFADLPLVSLDHQHFLVAYDLSCLPWRLRTWALGMSLIVRAHHTWQARTIVSGFFRAPLTSAYADAIPVGPMIRDTIRNQRPSIGDYTLSYLRPKAAEQTVRALLSSGEPMKVYGLGAQPARGQLTFHDFHPVRFVEDLAGAKAVVGAAGNQLIGESLYLRKPYLALPEGRHHEQSINAFFVKQMGVGEYCKLERFDPTDLTRFYERLETYRRGIEPHADFLDGTPDAVAAVTELLPPVPASRLNVA
ncbi:MAG: glycosyltransferase family protein [Planctomycetota bacterium]